MQLCVSSKGRITVPYSQTLLNSRKIPLQFFGINYTISVFIPVAAYALILRHILPGFHCSFGKQYIIVEMAEFCR